MVKHLWREEREKREKEREEREGGGGGGRVVYRIDTLLKFFSRRAPII